MGRNTAERGADRSAPADTGWWARVGQWLVRARGSDGHERHTLLLVLKSAVAATIAWFVADTLIQAQSPAFAPFSAVLMVQVTVYQSVVQSLRYVLAVAVGVGLQAVLGFMAGPDLLTFAMVALAALTLARWRRLGAQGSQVATAAFFAFSTFITTTTTVDRLAALGQIVVLVLVGCAIGVLVNLLLFPPMRYRSAEYGVRSLAHSLCDLLGDMAGALRGSELEEERTDQWHYRATRMGPLVARARSSVETASESVYYNPRQLLSRGRTRPTFSGYEAVVDALARMSAQLESVTRTLAQQRAEFAERAGSGDGGFLRRYGDLLAAIGDTVRLLSAIDADRLGEQTAELDDRVREAGSSLDRLTEDGSVPGGDGHTRTYGVLIVDATRLMDETRYTCEVLRESVEGSGGRAGDGGNGSGRPAERDGGQWDAGSGRGNGHGRSAAGRDGGHRGAAGGEND
ncbi:aromatic acid exporter family member 1 [Murinocardiopsis flavida]|uniref:Aromatic acid exporter family member 1 n=1 Tax=Murinocardiopsis flavida TaxID=645275 RepID=A0A2P8DH81_9ACTN|nr:aromatic acid exporter family protein [Murinocardiopsis flavida]PSK96574.1 aromatic acid exporter family member 1 [Murinocardiopsis flavida]